MSDLVKACRAEVERSDIHGTLEASYLLKEAADRIEDQEADLQRIHKDAVDRYERIIVLEAALRPFAEELGRFGIGNGSQHVELRLSGRRATPNLDLSVADFERAHSALHATQPDGGGE